MVLGHGTSTHLSLKFESNSFIFGQELDGRTDALTRQDLNNEATPVSISRIKENSHIKAYGINDIK
jgi:hypothetical protein